MTGRTVRWGLAGALLLGGAGCYEELPGERAARMGTPPRQEAPAEAGDAEDEWVENGVPVIEWVRLEPETPAPGARVTAEVRVNDPDGDEVEIGYAWRLNGRPIRGASGKEASLGSGRKGDDLQVTVTASDGWDESDPVTVRTVLGNSPPVLQNIAFDPLGAIHRGGPVTARPVAYDPDGDPLEFEYQWWVNGSELSSDGDVLDTSRLHRGDEVVVSVVASDGRSRSQPIRSEPIQVENSPPQIVSTPANAGGEGEYRYRVQAEDPDGDRRLRFRLEKAPAGMTIDPVTGELAWQPPLDADGEHVVEVVVDDLQGGVGSQRFTVVIGDPAPAEGEETAGATPAAAAAGR